MRLSYIVAPTLQRAPAECAGERAGAISWREPSSMAIGRWPVPMGTDMDAMRDVP